MERYEKASGYARGQMVGYELGILECLQKPLDAQDLAKAVRRALNAAHA